MTRIAPRARRSRYGPRRRAPLAVYDWASATQAERDARVDALALTVRHVAAQQDAPRTPGQRVEWERLITGYADEIMRAEGWLVYGVPDSRRAVSAGFPDRVYVRPPVCLFLEFKVGRGRLSDQQRDWLGALSAVDRVYAMPWRLEDVDGLVALARGLGKTPLPDGAAADAIYGKEGE